MDVHIDAGRAFLVIVLTMVGVVVINLAIYFMVKNKDNVGQIELLRKATHQAKNPWEIEDKALQDLSALVKQFKPEPKPEDTPSVSEQKQEGTRNG